MSHGKLWLLVSSLVLVPLTPAVAAAAESGSALLEEEVVVTGSRRSARSTTDSAVPVDVISGDDFIAQGNTDMNSMLATLVPSFNVNAQPISDAATIIRPANLRGLPPDNTLILVNGKRRHRAAVVAFLGGGIADGSQGPDLSVIPGIAVKQVEVLRDGAAAQYGSDAIAGVINFVLRDEPSGGSVEGQYGEYYEGDGTTSQIAGNIGFPLTDAGFANFSVEFKDTDATSRSVQRDDAAALTAAGNADVRNPAQIWGSPQVDGDFKFFGNVGLDIGGGREVYAFGNWAERTVEGGFFYRNPNTRDGVYNGPGDTILVADLTFASEDDGVACPVVNIVNLIPDPAALAAVAADPNCFAFNQKFPGGFTPNFGGDVSDTSLTGGTRGDLDSGLHYDLSASVGRSNVDFLITNTVNPNLAAQKLNMPTKFDPGSYIQLERSFNLDLSYPIAIGLASDLNIAGGLEYREEIFEIKAGDPNSFAIDPDLAAQGFGIGSNGFPGFKPEDAGEFDRDSYAAYLDLEADLTDALLLGVAVRYEDFSDFGSTTNGKVATRWQIVDSFAVRASASTGFRAPTVGQANVRNVTTAFTNGALADEATLPPTNPISVQKGGRALEPEESVSVAFGAVVELGNLSLTVDYFNVEVTDRIALTTTQTLTPADIAALLALGISDASSFTGVRFFTNDFDTTTEGVDLVASYPLDLFGGSTLLSAVFNWTQTTVDSFNPTIIGDTRVRQLEENLPEYRSSITASHSQGPFSGFVRVNYYGDYYEAHLDDGTLPISPDAEITIDTEVGFSFSENLTVVVGAQNLLDETPDENPWDFIVGAEYPVTSPMSFNGGFYYGRVVWAF